MVSALAQNNKTIAVCGAGGFIGGHLVSKLREGGCKHLRAIDVKPFGKWHQRFFDVENLVLDLKTLDNASQALQNIDICYNLAADMGGMGFIESNKTLCMLSVLINTNLLISAKEHYVEKFFFASSACVYPGFKQTIPNALPLKESDAYPADSEDGYGWEKLFSERMCRHFREEFQIATRMARYHNVYGPHGTYKGGREKVPAALCRKVIEAKLSGELQIEIWGDGEQTRSFMYIDDCITGTIAISNSEITIPINLGSDEIVTINQLLDAIEEIAQVKVRRKFNLNAPLGVRGRCSDNTLIKQELGWEPSTSLSTGLEHTYRWIYDDMHRQRHA